MESKAHQNEKEQYISKIRKIFLSLIEYSYIIFSLYIIITIVSLYTALNCNDIFSFETFFAIAVPYIYLPLRYYFRDYCNMPTKMCFA
tara:strand:- start:489 stop:752 length:264 start_codon:yes stop_codon:yes gene_type:complete